MQKPDFKTFDQPARHRLEIDAVADQLQVVPAQAIASLWKKPD